MITKADHVTAVPLQNVRIDSGFWGSRQAINRSATLPAIYHQSKITGRFDAWKLEWKPGQPNQPHHFWDSDAAKWIEAAAYSLTTHPDPQLEQQVDEVIDLIEAAQQPDGYLNIFYTVVEPENRWTNLRDMHELYCFGHLTEAAVAYYKATGKRKLLDVMCRYADHIDSVIGPEEGKKHGYPGHPEAELALIKLWKVTGEQRYFDLCKYFIDERGKQPHFYDIEARARGADPAHYWAKDHRYTQSHIPIREQSEMVGHSVRACYLYAGATDVAIETGDQELAAALRRLWENLTEKQMYITAGVGQANNNEGFTFDYDLPTEIAYAETCASISLVFWAQRMFHLDLDGKYIDVMERALYNGVLVGLSLEGDHFFYANPLSAYPHVNPYNQWGTILDGYVHYRRSEWFSCACCPPNIARLLADLGEYMYSIGEDIIYTHLYGNNKANLSVGGQSVSIEQQTNYPWDGNVKINVSADQAANFTLALRIPGWARGATIQVNGQPAQPQIVKGYAMLNRTWQAGDTVTLELPMPVERIMSNPKVRQNVGCIAIQRGPIVYCLEEVDNGSNLAQIVLPRDSELTATFEPDLLGGVVTVSGTAKRVAPAEWTGGLYQTAVPTQAEPFTLKAVPYAFWANREPGEMRVWIREV